MKIPHVIFNNSYPMTTWHVSLEGEWIMYKTDRHFCRVLHFAGESNPYHKQFPTYKWYFLIFNHNRWLGIVSQVKLSGNIIQPFFSSEFCILLKRNWWIVAECLRRSTCWSLRRLQAPFVWSAQKLERLWNRLLQQIDLITDSLL